MSERVPTGIDGLDVLIEGGFLRGDVILLAGGTGSGKTIFSTQLARARALRGLFNNQTSFTKDGIKIAKLPKIQLDTTETDKDVS